MLSKVEEYWREVKIYLDYITLALVWGTFEITSTQFSTNHSQSSIKSHLDFYRKNKFQTSFLRRPQTRAFDCVLELVEYKFELLSTKMFNK